MSEAKCLVEPKDHLLVDILGTNPGQVILKIGFQLCCFLTLEPWFSIFATRWTQTEMILESLATMDIEMEKKKHCYTQHG